MNTLSIVFIGCVKFSEVLLQRILTLKFVKVIGVVTLSNSRFNADFVSLEPLAIEYKIPCLVLDKNDQEHIATWVHSLSPDVIYCFGWSFLLHESVLSSSRLGAIGYHPAALPQNRGRHPIIWALALGLSETASTFFFMDKGADSGDIISQKIIRIDGDDTARTLYDKLLICAVEQIEILTYQLLEGSYNRIIQDHAQANYWRKRGRKDGEIDWRMSAQGIYNLVRALTHPYVGAHCVYKEREVKIWSVCINNYHCPNDEPGKVLKKMNNSFLVKCGDSAVEILEHGFSKSEFPKEGEYL